MECMLICFETVEKMNNNRMCVKYQHRNSNVVLALQYSII